MIAASRIMSIVDSIKENGYLGGRYRKKKRSFKYKVRVRKGFRSSFGSKKKDTHL